MERSSSFAFSVLKDVISLSDNSSTVCSGLSVISYCMGLQSSRNSEQNIRTPYTTRGVIRVPSDWVGVLVRRLHRSAVLTPEDVLGE